MKYVTGKSITRRKFVAGAAMAAVAAQNLWAATVEKRLLFVGTGTKTGSQGNYVYHWDPTHGELEALGLAVEADNPSFVALSPDSRFLFSVHEVDEYQGKKTGSVSSYSIDHSTGKLAAINTVASCGSGPCHLATDHTGRSLFVANYTGGSAASFQVAADGRLSEAVSEFHYSGNGPSPGQDRDRQESSHAHRATVSPDNRFVLVNDLGLDCIHIYRLDAATAKLTPNDPSEWVASPGSGPRVLQFHPSGRWAYCVNELASSVDQLDWDSTTGTLKLVRATSLLPEGFKGLSRASELVFDKPGRFAYVANRDYDFLATFEVEAATGQFSGVRRSPCGGKIPRHIALDPTERWMLVANQDSNCIAVFGRDKKSGRLASNGKTFSIQSPQCLVFA